MKSPHDFTPIVSALANVSLFEIKKMKNDIREKVSIWQKKTKHKTGTKIELQT